MTTGRINQVTIVRRGWPTGATDAPESSKLLVGAGGAPRGSDPRLLAQGAAAGIPLSPSSVPQGRPSAARGPLWAVRRAPGGLARAASTMAVSAARGCHLSCCGRGLARRPALPTAPIRRREP
ncbi:hypothetical protein HRG_012898 [Hirsutella rhossiliensis]